MFHGQSTSTLKTKQKNNNFTLLRRAGRRGSGSVYWKRKKETRNIHIRTEHHYRTKKKGSGVSKQLGVLRPVNQYGYKGNNRAREVEYWKCLSTVSDINEESCRWGWKSRGGGGYGWMDGKGQNGKVQAHKTCGSRQKQFRFSFSFLSTAPHGRVPRWRMSWKVGSVRFIRSLTASLCFAAKWE